MSSVVLYCLSRCHVVSVCDMTFYVFRVSYAIRGLILCGMVSRLVLYLWWSFVLAICGVQSCGIWHEVSEHSTHRAGHETKHGVS